MTSLKVKKRLTKETYFLINIFASVVFCGYFTNLTKGLFNGIVYGVFIATINYAVSIIFEYLLKIKKNSKNSKYLIPINFGFICLIFVFHSYSWNPPSQVVFNEIFRTNNIPRSVENINRSTEYPGKDPIYRLRFDIHISDLSKMLQKFEEYKEDNVAFRKKLKPRELLVYFDISYLMICKKKEWWDMDYILKLPMYKEKDVEFPSTLWVDKKADLITVYVSKL